MPHPKGPDWPIVVAKRVGAPPLRFKGALLDRREAALGGATIWVALWAQRNGGFVVGLSDGTTENAFKSKTVDALLDAVTAACHGAAFEPAQEPAPLTTLLRQAVDYRQRAAALRRLVGAAMADWEAKPPPAPVDGNRNRKGAPDA
ncbi:MAG: hypothetical protein AAF771_03070 [Pseudomonadota bacterium]